MTSGPDNDVNIRSLAWRLFRDSADEDYLMARWAMRVTLESQFWWNAQQAVEKYLKCALLLNGYPVKRYGHKLTEMLEVAFGFAGDLLPKAFIPPNEFGYFLRLGCHWAESTEGIVERIESRGDPNQRYRYYSIDTNRYEIHKFDELCFWLRRIAFPIDMKSEIGNKSYRDLLRENPNWQIHSTLHPLRSAKSLGSEKRLEALQWRNFSYFRDYAIKEGKFETGFSAQNSEIYLTVERGKEARPALEWLINNVYLNRDNKREIQDVINGM